MGKEVFKVELSRIEHNNVRISTEIILDLLPEYFYKMPASTSGRYHPSFSLGEGGLVRHVMVAERLLEEYFRDSAFGEYDSYTKDLMRMAILLHDGFKSGIEYSGHTLPEHPVIMARFLMENKDILFLPYEDVLFVASLILTHMGPWNKDKDGNVIMPVPTTPEEILIHQCDYNASRNFLNVCFNGYEIIDGVNREESMKLNRERQE